jgi:hypothetical protein
MFARDEGPSEGVTSSKALSSAQVQTSSRAFTPQAVISSQASSFTYQRLNADIREFRFLDLLPHGDFAAPIKIRLFTSTLSDPPSYEAVSYVWGDPNVTASVQDENGNSQFNVTTNLELGLRHLRFEKEARTLWVDALCINQLDIEERNSQVRQMRGIYLSARRVVVWLGEEGNAKVAMAFCSKMQREDFRVTWNEEPAYEACRELFSRPWWTRMWILQEVLHHKPVEVYIGSLSITLDDLCHYFNLYNKNLFAKEFVEKGRQDQSSDPWFKDYVLMIKSNTSRDSTIYRISSIRRHASSTQELYLLSLDSLRRFRIQKCSDPRDKLYALLGLCPDLVVAVNYDSSKSAVYTNAAKCILHHGLMDLLLAVECTHREIDRKENLPSWVPDWTLQQGEFPYFIYLTSYNFNASLSKEKPAHNFRVTFELYDEEAALLLKCIYIGIVVGVRGGYDCHNLYVPGGENTAKIFTYDGDPALRSERTTRRRELGPSRTLRNTSWGPMRTEVGDFVVVPAGSAVPLVLRRHGDAFLLVGGCWLIDSELQRSDIDRDNFHEDPGWSTIMHGSAWDEAKVETFRIV